MSEEKQPQLEPHYREPAVVEEKKEDIKLPLEKVLAMSAIEYCMMFGKKLEDYIAVNIHSDFICEVCAPYGTEIVVNSHPYMLSGDLGHYKTLRVMGTALIPKEKIRRSPIHDPFDPDF